MATLTQTKNDKVRHLYLKVQDDKYHFFVELVKNLGFVKIESEKAVAAKRKKADIAANIRQGFIDKKKIDEGKLKTYPIEQLFDE